MQLTSRSRKTTNVYEYIWNRLLTLLVPESVIKLVKHGKGATLSARWPGIYRIEMYKSEMEHINWHFRASA